MEFVRRELPTESKCTTAQWMCTPMRCLLVCFFFFFRPIYIASLSLLKSQPFIYFFFGHGMHKKNHLPNGERVDEAHGRRVRRKKMPKQFFFTDHNGIWRMEALLCRSLFNSVFNSCKLKIGFQRVLFVSFRFLRNYVLATLSSRRLQSA